MIKFAVFGVNQANILQRDWICGNSKNNSNRYTSYKVELLNDYSTNKIMQFFEIP